MSSLWLDLVQKLFASFAFLVGGFWVLMNYVRNRTHFPRLQVELRVEFVRRGDRQYLLATCQAKNVGLSIIRLPQPAEEGVGLPGLAISEQKLIFQRDARYDACWAQLRVSAHNEKWSAVAVAMRGEDVGDPGSLPEEE
jgi:hypothetical protein